MYNFPLTRGELLNGIRRFFPKSRSKIRMSKCQKWPFLTERFFRAAEENFLDVLRSCLWYLGVALDIAKYSSKKIMVIRCVDRPLWCKKWQTRTFWPFWLVFSWIFTPPPCWRGSYTSWGRKIFFYFQILFLTPFCNQKRYFCVLWPFYAQITHIP